MNIFKIVKDKIFPKVVRFSVTQRKKMLKGKNKNELIHMLIQNELVIARIMDKYNIKDLKKFR